MNIVSHYPNVPLSLANPPTVVAERENQRRELVVQTAQIEAYPRGRPIAQEGDNLRQKELPRQRGAQDKDSQTRTGQSAEDAESTTDLSGSESVDQTGSSTDQEKQKEQEAEKQTEQVEQEQVRKLSARDQEVRAHEQAHAAVGGQYAGSPSYEYQRGPDGRNYAVGGEVQIDVSKVSGDPEATINKMAQVRAAALAPAEPSAQDRRVAAEASKTAADARSELAVQQREELTKQSSAASDDNEDTDSKDGADNTSDTSNTASTEAANVSSMPLEMQQRSRVIAGVYYASSVPSMSQFRASA